MQNEPDGDLLRRFVHGEEEAFHALFRQFKREVYGWILRIVRDASGAEDVLIETFWKAYRARARFDVSRSFGAWLRGIATNAARDYLRDARSHAAGELVADNIAGPAGNDLALNESVARAFRRLPAKLQVVATLALIEERPYAEIAEALNLPLGTVKSRLARAVQRLQKEFVRLGVGP